MAPKKKKKTTVNSARGFTTVSVPSKPKQNPETPVYDQVHSVALQNESAGFPSGASSGPVHITRDDSPNTQNMSVDEFEVYLEDAELENILHSNSERIQSEASRQVKRLHSERRLARPQAQRLSVARDVLDDVAKAVLPNLDGKLSYHSFQTERRLQLESELDEIGLVLRLWLIQMILRDLKFPRITEVLEFLTSKSLAQDLSRLFDYATGLPEAFEWYAHHVDDKELPSYQTGLIGDSQREPVDEEPTLPETVADSGVRSTPTPTDQSYSSTVPVADAESLFELSEIESDENYDDPSLLADQYLQYQKSLYKTRQRLRHLSPQHSHQLTTREAVLAARVAQIERDPLFDSHSALGSWQTELRELEIDSARNERTRKRFQVATAKEPSQNQPAQEPQPEADGESEGLFGDIFGSGGTDSDQRADTTVSADIRVLNMGSWTGVQPRRLLDDACRTTDTRSTFKFTSLSDVSHISRLRLEMAWPVIQTVNELAVQAIPEGISVTVSSNNWIIEMISLATTMQQDSEGYLSTLALFLMFWSDLNDQKLFLRLPKVFRDLYQDLAKTRQERINQRDKSDLKWLLRTVRNARQSTSVAVTSNVTNTQDSSLVTRSKYSATARLSPEDSTALWISKSSSLEFQTMLKFRSQLPVHVYKDEILQAVEANRLIIICADTGAGKSTQVPSFILEDRLKHGNDCRVLVTQPRRISAISLARRVSQELGESRNQLGSKKSLVGYAIRLESKTSESTRITFATTGVLLRMLETDPDLRNLDYLILDEVHERTMDLDLLFIALVRLQQRQSFLKIILMSATVDAQKFSRYFANAPVLNIPGRTYPVELYYLEDAVEETLDMQSQDQSSEGVEDLEEPLSSDSDDQHTRLSISSGREYNVKTMSILKNMDEYRIDYDLIVRLADAIATRDKFVQYSKAVLIFMPGIGEIRRLQSLLLSRATFAEGWIIHMLHSSFSTEDLEKAFAVPPNGYRKIVIATNIAETGITIPDVTAVIDTCKEKVMRFDERRQLSRLTEGFISRSSARQRKGRAARVQNGLCFHLVTRYRYENLMMEQNTPEMLRLSLQDPILHMKLWRMGSVEDTLQAAIDPPTSKNVRRAIERLKEAGALDGSENLTSLGKLIARLPLDVAMGKLAVMGIIFQCLDTIVSMIAMLSSKSPFLPDHSGSKVAPKLAFSDGNSDLLTSFNAYAGWKSAKLAGASQQYCKRYHLHEPTMSQIEEQKTQLLVYLVDAGLVHLSSEEQIVLNKARTNGNRKFDFEVPGRYNRLTSDGVVCTTIALAFYPRVLLREGKSYRNVYTNQHIVLAASSVNKSHGRSPKWLCFYEAMQSKSGDLNVFETSPIPELALVFLMGDADFKLYSGIIDIDHGRIRISCGHWRHTLALKAFREAVSDVLDRCFRAPGLIVGATDQHWIDETARIMTVSVSVSNGGVGGGGGAIVTTREQPNNLDSRLSANLPRDLSKMRR